MADEQEVDDRIRGFSVDSEPRDIPYIPSMDTDSASGDNGSEGETESDGSDDGGEK